MISVIIPVFNEESSIDVLLGHLQENTIRKELLDVVIVDGGSDDGTLEKIKEYTSRSSILNVTAVNSEKGRGIQMHNGAQKSTGKILYFLHADSYPPKNYDQFIVDAVKNGHHAGCFRMKFKSWHPWLIIIGWLTRFSWKVSRGGDQSQFITRELYNKIGGYNTQIPIFEDHDLISRLYKRDQYYVIPKWLKTSARRYHEKGVLRLQWCYITIYWKKYRGASIDEIYKYYLSKCS